MNTRAVSAKGVTLSRASIIQASFNMSKLLLKPAVFILCLVPFFMAVAGVMTNKFVDPVEALLLISGEWGLRMLLITLCVTPIQFIFKWATVAKLRRMLGLFAFFYTTVHLAVWVVLDQGLDLGDALSAIVENMFITVGIIAWIGLLFLALTSNRFAVRKLGSRWKSLHNWIYLLVLLALVHFIWQVRASELLEPSIYLGAFALLLIWRFFRMIKR